MAQVVFDSAIFKARYPEFAAVNNDLLQVYFDESTIYLSNTDASPVSDIERRRVLLYMLTAHIATIGGALGVGGAKPVGRVSAGNEGSVGASLEYMMPGTHSWFTQTQYGASFWQATISLRCFRYRPCPTVY
jgi:Protein of unknown function (DUF4054)